MINFIQTEFLKLKNSKLFIFSLLSGLVPPFLMYVGVLEMQAEHPDFILHFSQMFVETHVYMAGLFAVFLLCVIISYLIGREYTEHTLKLVLTSPVSNFKYLTGKYIVFIIWTLMLFSVTFIGTIIFGYLGGGFLLTLVMTPFIFLSMIMRNIVPSMIVGSILVLVNIFSYGCPWGPYFPWMACYIISSNTITDYSCTLLTPIATVLITFIIGTVISYGYFKIKDVSL